MAEPSGKPAGKRGLSGASHGAGLRQGQPVEGGHGSIDGDLGGVGVGGGVDGFGSQNLLHQRGNGCLLSRRGGEDGKLRQVFWLVLKESVFQLCPNRLRIEVGGAGIQDAQ